MMALLSPPLIICRKTGALSIVKRNWKKRAIFYVPGDSSEGISKHRLLPSFKFPRVLKGDYCIFNTMPITSVSATGKTAKHDTSPYAPFIGLSMDNRLQVKTTYPDNILQDIESMGWIHFVWFIFSATAKNSYRYFSLRLIENAYINKIKMYLGQPASQPASLVYYY